MRITVAHQTRRGILAARRVVERQRIMHLEHAHHRVGCIRGVMHVEAMHHGHRTIGDASVRPRAAHHDGDTHDAHPLSPRGG